MKLLQKIYSLVGILLLSGGIFLASEKSSKKSRVLTTLEALSSIERQYQRVFPPGKNLYAKKRMGMYPWNKMLHGIQNYVIANAPYYQDFLELFALCWNVSWNLTNLIRWGTDQLYSREVPSPSLYTVSDNMVDQLEAKITDLTREINRLEHSEKNERQVFSGVSKVLLSLLRKLHFMVNKVDSDGDNMMVEKFGEEWQKIITDKYGK